MTFEIEIFLPSSPMGRGALTETLGPCKVITHPLFVTVTEHNNDAHLVGLADIVLLDRAQRSYTTMSGRVSYPRRIDLPDRIYVELSSGYARALDGDRIARMVRTKREPETLRGR